MFVSDIQQRTIERLGENPAAPVFYTAADILVALNLAESGDERKGVRNNG